jgi:hypothetical protein
MATIKMTPKNNSWDHIVLDKIKYPFGFTVYSWAKRLAPKQTGKKISGHLKRMFDVFYTKLDQYEGPQDPRKEYEYYYSITEALLVELDWISKLKSSIFTNKNSANERFKINIDAEDIRVFQADLQLLKDDFRREHNYKASTIRRDLETRKIRLQTRIKTLKSDPIYKTYYTNNGMSRAPLHANRMNFGTGALPILGNAPLKASAARKKAELDELGKELIAAEKAMEQLISTYEHNRSRINSRSVRGGGTRKKKRTPQ